MNAKLSSMPLIGAAVATAMVLAACGGGSAGPSAAASPSQVGETPPAADPAAVGSTPSSVATKYANLAGASLGPGAALNGAQPFPADNPWNTDVSRAPVDPNSDALIASIGLATGLRPDFGSGTWQGAPIGIPYTVVSSAQPKVAVRYMAYGSESDPGPFPIPPNAPVEGEQPGVPGSGGDRHVIVVDRDANRIVELYRAFLQPDGTWQADSGAEFRADSNAVRPTARPGWTSADAAGLPIFPGLVRYDEAASGAIRHALRFTAPRTRTAYVPPATHYASSSSDPNLPPMGMRVRLKASYVIPADVSVEARAILQALKTYGMLLADNGSAWYLSGAPDPRWNDSRLRSELSRVQGQHLEVVRMDGLVTP